MKLKPQQLFWILQVLGWGLLGGSQILLKSTLIKDIHFGYAIAEGLLITISGILFSSCLRYFYKKRITIEDFNFTSLFQVVGAIVIVGIALVSFQYIIASNLYRFLLDKDMEYSFWANLVNVLFMLTFWSILYFSLKAILKSQKEKLTRVELESNLKESQLNALKGQINPHFMFNSLNNIRGLMLEDVPKSREMITKLSELLRYSLNSGKVDKIAINEELETVRNYIELSKIQLEDRLQYKEDIDDSLGQVQIPPMLMQMLIENAIKHGIANQLKGGEVLLRLYKENLDLYIEVINNGKLKEDSASTKIGVVNMQERLRLLYGNRASFSLREVGDQVIARIKMPID